MISLQLRWIRKRTKPPSRIMKANVCEQHEYANRCNECMERDERPPLIALVDIGWLVGGEN